MFALINIMHTAWLVLKRLNSAVVYPSNRANIHPSLSKAVLISCKLLFLSGSLIYVLYILCTEISIYSFKLAELTPVKVVFTPFPSVVILKKNISILLYPILDLRVGVWLCLYQFLFEIIIWKAQGVSQ